MKNHIKNYIKIMGLAAVPFGTAQAENYGIEVWDKDGLLYVSGSGGDWGCFPGDVEQFRDEDLGEIVAKWESLFTESSLFGIIELKAAVRGYHDEKGGKVNVADTKFSEGKSVTRKDVEEQWQREEVLIKDMKPFDRVLYLCRFAVDCKIYNLPSGCTVSSFVLTGGQLVKFFLVKDTKRSFGGSEYMLVVVVPDDCERVFVRSVIPTVVCGGEVRSLSSSNEILSPSVRSSLLSVLGQKELSVNHYAAVCECKADKPEVLLKDCSFVQQAKAVGQMRFGSKEDYSVVGCWRRFPYGSFCLFPPMVGYAERKCSFIDLVKCTNWTFCSVRNKVEKFSEFFHRGAKRKAVCSIKALAKDNAVRCIGDLKEKLKKLEGKLKEVSEKERLKK